MRQFLIILLLVVTANQAVAQTISSKSNLKIALGGNEELGCVITLSDGEIRNGDSDRLIALIESLGDYEKLEYFGFYDDPTTWKRLCLSNITGGSFSEAFKIADMLAARGGEGTPFLLSTLGTAVVPNSSCESACAIIFLGGKQICEGTCVALPDRILPVNSRLGFHAPRLQLERQGASGIGFTEAEVGAAYTQAIAEIGMLVERRVAYGLSMDALHYILSTPSDNMLWIDSIRFASIFNVGLYGISYSPKITEISATNACFNTASEFIYGYRFDMEEREFRQYAYQRGVTSELSAAISEEKVRNSSFENVADDFGQNNYSAFTYTATEGPTVIGIGEFHSSAKTENDFGSGVLIDSNDEYATFRCAVSPSYNDQIRVEVDAKYWTENGSKDELRPFWTLLPGELNFSDLQTISARTGIGQVEPYTILERVEARSTGKCFVFSGGNNLDNEACDISIERTLYFDMSIREVMEFVWPSGNRTVLQTDNQGGFSAIWDTREMSDVSKFEFRINGSEGKEDTLWPLTYEAASGANCFRNFSTDNLFCFLAD